MIFFLILQLFYRFRPVFFIIFLSLFIADYLFVTHLSQRFSKQNHVKCIYK